MYSKNYECDSTLPQQAHPVLKLLPLHPPTPSHLFLHQPPHMATYETPISSLSVGLSQAISKLHFPSIGLCMACRRTWALRGRPLLPRDPIRNRERVTTGVRRTSYMEKYTAKKLRTIGTAKRRKMKAWYFTLLLRLSVSWLWCAKVRHALRVWLADP